MDKNSEDLKLLEEFKNGSQRAFDEIYANYKSYVYSITLNILWNRADAEDASQDTFMNLYKNIHSFKGDSPFKTWLSRIALNQSYMILRSQKKIVTQLIDDVPYADAAEDRSTVTFEYGYELREIIQAAVNRLCDTEKEVFMLRYVHDRPTDEILSTLKLTRPGLKSRLFRARESTKTRIERYLRAT